MNAALRRTNLLLAAVGMLLACSVVSNRAVAQVAEAQQLTALIDKLFSGPKIDVTIEHPPTLPLKITTVAIGEPQGRCADSLSTRIEEAFVTGGVAVIDRRHLREVLSEHKLQVSGMVDERTAARIGQLLGAQALLFLQVQECAGSRERRESHTDKKTNATTYEYITTGRVAGSVRVIDLTTGRVLAAPRFEENAAASSPQNFIADDVVIAEAEKLSATKLTQMMMPWKETKSMAFFNDSACNLKTANRLLGAKDFDGALAQSQQNLETCQTSGAKPAILARAYYNLGVMQLLKSDYDGALQNLMEADRISSARVFLDAIADCRRAKELSVALLQYHGAASPNLRAGQTFPATSKPPKAAPDAKANRGGSMEDRLTRLQGLRDKKLISQSEYEQKRQEILSEI